MGNWKKVAEEMYADGKKINDIAATLQLSRKTVSKYINSLPCSVMTQVKEKRKKMSMERRKEQKKSYRKNELHFEGVSLRRQHDIDVMVLSREKYF